MLFQLSGGEGGNISKGLLSKVCYIQRESLHRVLALEDL